MSHKPSDVAVLNTIQAAAADVVLSGGKLQLNDGSVDLLTDSVKISDALAVVKTAYAAGTASVKEYDLAGVALAANTQYVMSVEVPQVAGFNNVQVSNGNFGRNEANELIRIRTYVVWVGAAPTANELRDLFIARINDDAGARVTAASGGAGVVELTLDDVNDGDFSTEAPAGAAESVTTPYVAPSGTPALVNADSPNAASATGQYSTWSISLLRARRHNNVGGGNAFFEEVTRIYADEGATNFAAFETELDAVLAGTHTPASDYLGV